MNAQSSGLVASKLRAQAAILCVCVDGSLKDQALGIVLAIEPCILPLVKMSSSRVRASLLSLLYTRTPCLHLSQSLLSLPNSCLSIL